MRMVAWTIVVVAAFAFGTAVAAPRALKWNGGASGKLSDESWDGGEAGHMSPQNGDTLVFGSESAGLPEPFYERYRDSLYTLPMPGPHARCHNLANAASIALYEAYRQIGGA